MSGTVGNSIQNNNNQRKEEYKQQPVIVPATQRPNGTWRKEIKIQPGYHDPYEQNKYIIPVQRNNNVYEGSSQNNSSYSSSNQNHVNGYGTSGSASNNLNKNYYHNNNNNNYNSNNNIGKSSYDDRQNQNGSDTYYNNRQQNGVQSQSTFSNNNYRPPTATAVKNLKQFQFQNTDDFPELPLEVAPPSSDQHQQSNNIKDLQVSMTKLSIDQQIVQQPQNEEEENQNSNAQKSQNNHITDQQQQQIIKQLQQIDVLIQNEKGGSQLTDEDIELIQSRSELQRKLDKLQECQAE